MSRPNEQCEEGEYRETHTEQKNTCTMKDDATPPSLPRYRPRDKRLGPPPRHFSPHRRHSPPHRRRSPPPPPRRSSPPPPRRSSPLPPPRSRSSQSSSRDGDEIFQGDSTGFWRLRSDLHAANLTIDSYQSTIGAERLAVSKAISSLESAWRAVSDMSKKLADRDEELKAVKKKLSMLTACVECNRKLGLEEEAMYSMCGHLFHTRCMRTWTGECKVCR